MEHKFITFQTTQQIIRFVNLVSKLDFDVDVKYGSRIVDAKSILGLRSLASFKAVKVVFHTVAYCNPRLDKLFAPAS